MVIDTITWIALHAMTYFMTLFRKVMTCFRKVILLHTDRVLSGLKLLVY